MSNKEPQFASGQVIKHKKFGYRGVIVSVDAGFQGSERWYQEVALSKPAKDKPWYHVLVDGSTYETYVAEKHLMRDASAKPITHPLIEVFWDEFEDGQYLRNRILN